MDSLNNHLQIDLLKNQSLGNFNKAAKSAAQSFESVFLFEVLQSMYAGVEPGAFGGGSSEKLYQSMLNEEVAKSISKQGGIGIADSIYNEIIKTQQIANR
tara:strand:- start:506 stop:805 length:300 start_codon:yes stop_codon:yes gene_type:complete